MDIFDVTDVAEVTEYAPDVGLRAAGTLGFDGQKSLFMTPSDTFGSSD